MWFQAKETKEARSNSFELDGPRKKTGSFMRKNAEFERRKIRAEKLKEADANEQKKHHSVRRLADGSLALESEGIDKLRRVVTLEPSTGAALLERQTLQAGRRKVPLQPGMSLTADVFLRDRRFISTITGGLENRLRSLERMR